MNEHFIRGFEKVALSSDEKKTIFGGGALGAGLGAVGGATAALIDHQFNLEKAKAHNRSVKMWRKIVQRNPDLPKKLIGAWVPFPKINKKLMATAMLTGGLGGLALGGLIGAKALKSGRDALGRASSKDINKAYSKLEED